MAIYYMGNKGCYVIKHCTMGCYRRCSRIDSTAAGCDGIIHSDEKRKEVEEKTPAGSTVAHCLLLLIDSHHL